MRSSFVSRIFKQRSSRAGWYLEIQSQEIDEDFFDSLLLHPDQLLHDRTRLEWTGSYFEFQGILAGDLADKLGFQSGDQLDSVNGYDVSTIAEAWTAFSKVYGSNSFTVHVTRSGSVEILEYVLVP